MHVVQHNRSRRSDGQSQHHAADTAKNSAETTLSGRARPCAHAPRQGTPLVHTSSKHPYGGCGEANPHEELQSKRTRQHAMRRHSKAATLRNDSDQHDGRHPRSPDRPPLQHNKTLTNADAHTMGRARWLRTGQRQSHLAPQPSASGGCGAVSSGVGTTHTPRPMLCSMRAVDNTRVSAAAFAAAAAGVAG